MSKGSYYPKSQQKPKSPGDMMKQLQQVQKQMEEAQAELADETVEYSAGGGVIKVVADGQQNVISIHIDPQVIDPDDPGMLEDLVLAAVTGALEESGKLAADRMGGLAGGLGVPGLPGL